MDKKWMHLVDTTSDEYIVGVERFLNFAYVNNPPGDTHIYFPCIDCLNRYLLDRQLVKTHCIYRGFNREYDNWTRRHGESYVYAYKKQVNQDRTDSLDSPSSDDGGIQMIWEAMYMASEMDGNQPRTVEEVVGHDKSISKFFTLLKDAESPLYPGCEEFTSLQFTVELMHLKVISKWTNQSFTSLLTILNKPMPKDVKLPKSYREANKMASDMRFGYETYDVCPNHCMLFRNENANLSQCDICSASRYVDDDNKKAAKKGSMDEKLADLREEERTNLETREKIFREIMGSDSRGRVLCYGIGVGKSIIFGTKKSSRTKYGSVGEEIRAQKVLIESQQAVLTVQEAKIKELEVNQAQMLAQQAEFRRQLKALIGPGDNRSTASSPHVRDASSSFK